MSTFRCLEKNAASCYAYRSEIETQIEACAVGMEIEPRRRRVVIRTVAKLLKMNLLDCTLLVWLLKEGGSDWTQLDLSAKDCHVFAEEGQRGLFLLLLLHGYYVKSSLSDCFDPELEKDVTTAVPAFKTLYNSWRPRSSLANLSLLQLNQMFITSPQPVFQAKRDYNLMVAKILQLSKSYNIGGNEKATRTMKQIPHVEEKPEMELLEEESANGLVNLSGKFPEFRLFHHEEEINWGEDEDKQAYLLRSSSRKYRSGELPNLLADSRNQESRLLLDSDIWRRAKPPQEPQASYFDDI